MDAIDARNLASTLWLAIKHVPFNNTRGMFVKKNRVTRLIRHEFVFQVNILTDAWHVYMHAQGQCNFTCDLRAGFSWNARTAGVQSRFYVSNPNLPTDPAIT